MFEIMKKYYDKIKKVTTMKDQILESLNLLKVKRPIFHSEDDFKFSFSTVLQQKLGNGYEIRIERPQEITMVNRDTSKKDVRAPIDIVVIDRKTKLTYPIELKYKTKKCEIKHEDETYILTDHGATDIGRFSFRKDIYRLEQLMNDKTKQGFFIVITNENKYLENVSCQNTLDKNFSFHNGMFLKKEDKGWNYEKQLSNGYILNHKLQLINPKNKTLHWTSKREQFYKLDLNNTYTIKWEEYHPFDETEFHISVVEITSQI